MLPGGALSDGLGSSDLPGPVLNQSGGDFLCPFDANTQRNVTAVQQAGCKLRSPGPVGLPQGARGRGSWPRISSTRSSCFYLFDAFSVPLRPLPFTDAQTGTWGSVAKATQAQKQFRCGVGGVTVQCVFLSRALLGTKKVLLVTSPGLKGGWPAPRKCRSPQCQL